MKKIKLTKGKVALVDDEDFEYLNQWKWHIQPSINTEYAIRTEWVSKNKCICIRMHRDLLAIKDSRIKVDHKDGNGLNNQKVNLRECTQAQNGRNTRSRKNSSSKYLGVHFCKTRKKWVAQIQHDKKAYSAGLHLSEADAAIAYNKKAIELHGEFANLNRV